MEVNRKSHPDCVYASNPFHECASACLERIAQGHGRKHPKKQASKILSFSASFGRKKKESVPPSPYASRPYQNNAYANNNHSAKDHRPMPPPAAANAVKKKTFLEEKKSSFSSVSSEELPAEKYSRDEAFNHKQEQLSETVLLSPKDLIVDSNKAVKPVSKKKADDEKNGSAGEIRSFSFLSPPRSNENDEESNDEDDDDDDDDDEENNEILGEEIELESVLSESCVSVGKYRVRPAVSAILTSIIDKHGDIAVNCKLESASMRARYLECLCLLVQELKSTPVTQLTKVKVKEMLAVLKDLDSVNIEVGWLRTVLEEFAEFKDVDRARERHVEQVRSTRAALEDQEADLARMEKEVTEARSRVEEARARVAELEKEGLRLEGIGSKGERFKGKSFLEELL
ncbi:PREDICTED: uncharacterized protein LOC104807376 [Tarenaya hassleriana]|uniref:uncharacterized protein LOC104807376 n=1 Tax=Tarenaya hassleriana TaxID=28532 RepID=UPI00053C54C8|nr:PREDICTED: uncharacterized protein LOC104807376 [Tarenaya hassleriana]XP_010530919.1 PREDICTED: uncharacterized protein LOC104807376 [Tarenaya hassleriana]XP_010530920.1 PREDICTED: uncharacterized protein LOC104807376 [Tarenaya hassleriana]XP_010530921.1 PREDICTED: uncharacterized protein LOC104807376 [Tarenaya hassleriana]XP_010530922.1 PREDICTED: uncharacterized protein LOC104807376 [Tarenaya hassleriana]XP_010530923.1 PREDICTED: uncharacterized protein LOC104807376 [Tarenaya hassleriana]